MAVPVGAVMETWWSNHDHPDGAVPEAGPVLTLTAPSTGTVTAVCTGASAVAPVP